MITRIPQEDLEELIKLLDSVEPAKPVSGRTEFYVEELPDRFVLNGVAYNGEPHVVAWGKELLDCGNHHKQEDWITLQKEGQLGEYSLADAKLYNATILSLYRNRECPQKELVEKVKSMFADDFKKYWMMTSSNILYSASGVDEIKHNIGLPNETVVSGAFVGPNGWVTKTSSFGDIIPVILGTDDLGEIEQAYEWISGKKPYLYRINSKPENDISRAVVLGFGNNGRFNLYANVNVGVRRSARGVVRIGK